MSRFDDVIALQNADTALDQLRHHRAHLPEAIALADAKAALATLDGELGPLTAQRAAVAEDQSHVERRADELKSAIVRVNGQLYGGSVTSAKELAALQHELEGFNRQLSDTEDLVLEQMELAEPLDVALAVRTPEREVKLAEIERCRVALATEQERLDSEIAAADAQRVGIAAAVQPELMKPYNGLRTRLGGVGAARLDGSRCLGCHIQIPEGEMISLRALPPDELVFCPECGRILVR